jgi:hypothetical protein
MEHCQYPAGGHSRGFATHHAISDQIGGRFDGTVNRLDEPYVRTVAERLNAYLRKTQRETAKLDFRTALSLQYNSNFYLTTDR